VDDGRSKIVWSGDTTFSPEWILQAAQDPRVARIFHECQFGAPFRGSVHTHWEEIQTLPAEIKGRITLMHHTQVPDGADLSEFEGAAERHQDFDL
jgi:ribonuclease BN (tRNA processing enzyme)